MKSSTRILALGMLFAVSLQAQSATTDPSSATTDLANAPLITNAAGSILPNVFLVLDDSQSMYWDFMPDENLAFGAGTYGVGTSQCNGVYYNPTISYTPPVLAAAVSLTGGATVTGSPIITYASNSSPQVGQIVAGVGIPVGAYITAISGSTQATLNVNATATGAGLSFSIGSYPQASFTAAWKDGYIGATGGAVNLSNSFVDATVDRVGDAGQAAFYYQYSGFQNTAALKNYHNSNSAFYKECLSNVGSTTAVDGTHPVNTLFAKVVISSVTPSYTGGVARADCAAVPTCTFAEESQNFANWYSYYRTRMLMMKTSTGLAFSSLTSNFRVGYASINNNTTSDYLGLGQFSSTQKTNWYNKLYSALPGNATPLRETLVKVGKMYANQLPTFNGVTVVDPIQFSCQQNFTILTTDGFWNVPSPTIPVKPCINGTDCALNGTLTPVSTPTIANQDGNVPRPYLDSTSNYRSTSQTTQTQTQQVQSTTQTQSWTEQNQSQTNPLQTRTGPLQWQTDQQYKDSTLNWTTNLQHTDATLQWKTNLQHTDATLQWKTNLQHTDAPLQWQTNLQQTVQQQMWSTDQQQTTAPLQWQTKQQMTTAPLLWATNLQAATAALQWQTNLQATTGTLQKQTSQLQSQTTQLQKSTSTLQQQTSQLQASTSTLQGSTMYLQTRSSANYGSTWTGWSDVSSCTWNSTSADGYRRQCQYVTATGGSTLWTAGAGTWTNPASCTTSFGTSTADNVVWATGSSCRYTAWTAYAGAPSCTALAQSAGPSYTVGTATQCQTVVTSAFANAASCTATTVPNASGNTTQCQYTAWTGWAGAATCSALAQSTNPNYTVGTATQCQSVVTSAYANAASCTATTVPNASGNTTQCQYLAYTAYATVASGGTCTPAAQSASPNYTVGVATNCQLLSPTTAYVATNPPTCSVTYNAAGTSTAGAGGTAVSACSNTGATYSALANVAASAACATGAAGGSGGGSVQCAMAAATPAYLAYGATCTNTYNAGGTSTANASGQVTACSTNASFGTTTTLTGTQSCATSANVQCSTGAATTAYLAYGAAACATTYNAGGTSTASGGLVVTACPVNAAYSPITTLAAGQVCNGAAANTLCTTGTATTVYLGYAQASAAPPCTVNFNAGGSSTAGAGGLVTTACPTAAWTPPAAIAACTNSAHVTCSLGATLFTSYVATYPPQCVIGTNNAGMITTACTLNAAFSPVTNIGAGNTCTAGVQAAGTPTWASTIQCVTGVAAAPAYVTTYAPTCATTFNAAGASTANASGNVIIACPVNATYSGGTNVGAGGTCNGALPNVQCATTGPTSAYVTTYPPAANCVINFNAAGTSTANASGKVTTACPNTGATYSTGTTVIAANSYICDGTLPNVNCSTTGSTTARVATYPPTCTTNYNGATASSTANASAVVTTACPTTSYGGGGTVGANNTCDVTKPNVNCSATGGSAITFTTYPPTCTVTYNGTTASSTADASGKVRTCSSPTTPLPANSWLNTTFGSWTNTTVANGNCTTSSTVNCQYLWTSFANTGSTCTTNYSPGPGALTILNGTDCKYQYPGFVGAPWVNYIGATCTPVAESIGSPYTVTTARACRVDSSAPYVGVSSCTSTGGTFNASGQRISCQTVVTGPSFVDTCTAAAAAAGNSWTTTACSINTLMSGQGVASCTPVAASASTTPPHTTTTCNTTSTAGVRVSTCNPAAADLSNAWTATVCTSSGGTYDTLADVAEYYYMTDLRTTPLGNNLSGAPSYIGTDVSTNNVPAAGIDTATYQHMTTFTLGLGASGSMVFDPNYNATPTPPGDYYSLGNDLVSPPIAAGVPNGSTMCPWQPADINGKCNWPIPASANAFENIDDLWHAAVNGRGTYFSAANPSDVTIGLSGALLEINKRTGSASAATTSTAFITQGDNFIFSSNYSTVDWTGELIRQQIDPVTGSIIAAIDWSAQAKLDTNVSRTLYTYDPTNSYNGGGTNKLKLFTYTNLTATQKTYFDLPTLTPKLSQFCTVGATCLGLTAEASAAGSNLVNFIAGDRTNEGAVNSTKYFRLRVHMLGDIVNSEAAYVKVPSAFYSDPGYTAYKASMSGRRAMVYVGANDGYLHAFRAADDPTTLTINEGGQEDWAYLPALVMPDVYKLADKAYGLNHRYYVDGTPQPADICVSFCTDPVNAVWKTILVGGLNSEGMLVGGSNGGRGYYALDITNPASPKALWEFTDANMGFTFGNPKVVKLADGTWVVVVTSGYNNTGGDGQGHLYVLNANTGALIRDISTGVGTATSPSGLSRIDIPVTTPGIDATAIAVYGGDLEGNLWRFDINGNLGAVGYDAQLLATLQDASGNKQPITSKPLITVVSGKIVVNVGTGRYLGNADKNTVGQDSFYAIKDTFPTTSTPSVAIYGNPRTYTGTLGSFVQQTQTSILCPTGTPTTVCATGQSVYVSSNNPVNFATNGGWYVDFNHVGERDNTDPAIIKGTLVIATNLPIAGSCSFGGDSYLYQLNYLTGAAVSTAPNGIVGVLLGHELTSRPVVVMLEDGTTRTYTQGSSGGTPKATQVFDNASADGVARRISWRELLVN